MTLVDSGDEVIDPDKQPPGSSGGGDVEFVKIRIKNRSGNPTILGPHPPPPAFIPTEPKSPSWPPEGFVSQ